MPTSHFSPTEMQMVDEELCVKCKVPRIYGRFNTCRGGSTRTEEKHPTDHAWKTTGRKVPRFYEAKTFKLNPVKRLIGFEVEVNEYQDGAKVTEYAKKIGAGMCQDCAFEMQTPPANGDELVRQTKEISELIRSAGSKCWEGSGLHTHVDCRDLSWEDMRRVCVLYGKTEGALYSIIDPRRAGSLDWCKPVGGKELVEMMSNPLTGKENIIKFVYGGVENLKRGHGRRDKDPYGGDRYLGLNLHSWFMRGTIEFRMHHGTTKWEKMLNWGMLLGGMVESAVRASGKEIEEWPNGKAGMLKYAPTDGVRDWVESRWKYFAAKRKNPNQPIF